MEQRETIIRNYIDAYNRFDIDAMLADFDDNIQFKNISENEINMSITGIKDFREQAEMATEIFSERQQAIQSITYNEDTVIVDISYFAVLAVDFPNGLKQGDTLSLQGRSVFTFSGNKIIALTDIS